MIVAKAAFSQFKARKVASIPSIRVSYFSSSSSQLQLRPQADENSRVAVWWDIGNCRVPEDFDLVRVPQAIEAAVRANGINGPVHITAVADVFQAEHSTLSWKTLADAGVTISHAYIGQLGYYLSMSKQLELWLERNPPPAHLFLIADWVCGVDSPWFMQDNYNILLASNEGSAVKWPGYTNTVWRWNDLLKGGNLIGKHFNEIPDHPLYSEDSERNSSFVMTNNRFLSFLDNPDLFFESCPEIGSNYGAYNLTLSEEKEKEKLVSPNYGAYNLTLSEEKEKEKLVSPNYGAYNLTISELKEKEKLVSPPNTALVSMECRSQHHMIHDTERVMVWWDFDSIPVPNRDNRPIIGEAILQALRASGMNGWRQIHCFADAFHLSRSACADLSSQMFFSVAITHVPNGGKQSVRECLLADLKLWTSTNPPPAHMLLITSDPSFASTLRELRASNYNTLVAGNEVPDVLCKEASIVWSWNDLLEEGEKTVPRYFNQAPDASLYGHYDVPLEEVKFET